MANYKSEELGSAAAGRVPKAAYLLTGCIGVIGANSLVLGPIAPEVALSLSTNVSTIMLAASAFGLGTALSALFLAHHIDRLGAVRVLKMCLILLAIALLSSAVAPTAASLIAAQLVVGLIAGIALPAIYSSAIAVAPSGLESKVVSVVLTGWTISMVAGVSLSVVLSEVLGWRAVYGIIAVLSLAAWYGLSKVKITDKVSKQSLPMPLTAINLPGIKPLLLCCFAFMGAFYGLYGFIGDYLHNALGLPILANSLIALIYGLGFGCAIIFNPITQRVAAKLLLTIVLAIVAFLYLTLAKLGGYASTMYIILFLLGIVNHLAVNLLIVRLTDIDPNKRGTIMGLYSAVTYIGVFIGTSSYGQIYLHYGFSALAYTSMALTVIAAIIGQLGQRSRSAESIQQKLVQ
ncbi:MFS transporter [Vibrio marisflavi]|uniref:Sugar efflux transporter n=1 Tax=Vibrio marisflavi CECT 7928 TaxID=634439 RepID=A0ABN8DZU4_9VIBR|nr:MFS transporter [Vibrio marisflavi]CAH0537369.1 sugar efflux transporter [Vibrio marisflavi CECT 7928]